MKLTVFGATGGTGTQVVAQALDAGHEVVAVVRDPSRLVIPGAAGRGGPAAPDTASLAVVQADVMDPDAITPALEGADAAVSALGPRRAQAGREGGRDRAITVCSDGIRSIIRAMDKTGVRRLVAVSANGAFVADGDGLVARLVGKPILQRLLRDAFADVRQMEDEIRASETDWTIIRPPRLTNGPRRGRYRTAVDGHAGTRISRADLADAILTALATPSTVNHFLGVGY
ncbi:MAG: SDR family oxidoreductase [Microbispora sp.]|nr:SDR family oxidoreductase [Microbispora sp.]